MADPVLRSALSFVRHSDEKKTKEGIVLQTKKTARVVASIFFIIAFLSLATTFFVGCSRSIFSLNGLINSFAGYWTPLVFATPFSMLFVAFGIYLLWRQSLIVEKIPMPALEAIEPTVTDLPLALPLALPSFSLKQTQDDLVNLKEDFSHLKASAGEVPNSVPLNNSEDVSKEEIERLFPNYTEKQTRIEKAIKQVIGLLTQKNIMSSNYLERTFDMAFSSSIEKIKVIEKEWRNIRDLLEDQRNRLRTLLSSQPYQNKFMEAILRAKQVEKSSLGNCLEMCCLSFLYLIEIFGISTRIDIYQIDDGDHVFILIGNTNDSTDYRKWDKEATVFDPWSNIYFPASELEKNLKCCKWDSNQPKQSTLYSFNPHVNTLSIKTSNLISYEQFTKFMTSDSHNEIKILGSLLQNLYLEQSESGKVKIAEEMLKRDLTFLKTLQTNARLRNDYLAASTLISQLRHFLKIPDLV